MSSYCFPYPEPDFAPQCVVIGFGQWAHKQKGPWFQWEAPEGMYSCDACAGKGRGGRGSKTWVSAQNHLNAAHNANVAKWVEAAYEKGTFERGSIKLSTIELDRQYRWEWSPTHTAMMNQKAQDMYEQQFDDQGGTFSRAAAASAAAEEADTEVAPGQTGQPWAAAAAQSDASSQVTREQAITSIQQQLDALQESNERLESSFQEKIDMLQNVIETLTRKIAEEQQSHETKIDELKTKVDELQQANDKTQHKCDSVQQAVNNLHWSGSPSTSMRRAPSTGLLARDAPGGPGPAPAPPGFGPFGH